jgi:hypothetical protein
MKKQGTLFDLIEPGTYIPLNNQVKKMRILIDLPKSVRKELEQQAKTVHAKMKFKPYVEMILSEIANSKKPYKPLKSKT